MILNTSCDVWLKGIQGVEWGEQSKAKVKRYERERKREREREKESV